MSQGNGYTSNWTSLPMFAANAANVAGLTRPRTRPCSAASSVRASARRPRISHACCAVARVSTDGQSPLAGDYSLSRVNVTINPQIAYNYPGFGLVMGSMGSATTTMPVI
jgi:hypothetical protein